MENSKVTKKNMETTAESVEKSKTSEVKENKKRIFTRDEVNKIINAEKQKERQAVLKEVKLNKEETVKIKKMKNGKRKYYESGKENSKNIQSYLCFEYFQTDQCGRQENIEKIIHFLEKVGFKINQEISEKIK